MAPPEGAACPPHQRSPVASLTMASQPAWGSSACCLESLIYNDTLPYRSKLAPSPRAGVRFLTLRCTIAEFVAKVRRVPDPTMFQAAADGVNQPTELRVSVMSVMSELSVNVGKRASRQGVMPG